MSFGSAIQTIFAAAVSMSIMRTIALFVTCLAAQFGVDPFGVAL
jgi:hypothetical protein